MRRVHIIGGKNHGKTTLISELVGEFRARRMRVGTIKHTHHHHELDTPGKDSHRHRDSGAAVVGILSRSMNAVFWPNEDADSIEESHHPDERYAAFAPMFSSCDLVLVEGDTRTSALKLEVCRVALDGPTFAATIPDVHAIVTDDPLELQVPTLSRADVPAIADFIVQALNVQPPEAGKESRSH